MWFVGANRLCVIREGVRQVTQMEQETRTPFIHPYTRISKTFTSQNTHPYISQTPVHQVNKNPYTSNLTPVHPHT